MAITQIQRQPVGFNYGEDLGNKLEQLVGLKMNQLNQQGQQSRMARSFESLGLPGHIASFSPEIQQAIVKNWAEEGGLQNLIQGNQKSFQPQRMVQKPQESPYESQLLTPSTSMQAIAQQALGNQSFQQQGQEHSRLLQQQKKPMTRADIEQQDIAMGKMKQPYEILQMRPIGKTQKEIYNNARREQNRIEKSLMPQIQTLDKGANAAKKNEVAYETLRKTVKSGKLTPASWARFRHAVDKNAKSIGSALGGALGIIGGAILGTTRFPGVGTVGGALSGGATGRELGSAIGGAIPEFVGTPLDQAFNKTVYGFMRNAKDFFGSQIPLGEAEMFMQTLPTLRMDDEAKLAVIDNMEGFDKLVEAQQKAKNSIIKEHGGFSPSNLFELINERVKPEYNKIKSNIVKTIEELIANT